MSQNATIDRNDPDLRLALVKFVENFTTLFNEEADELMFEYDEDADEAAIRSLLLERFTEYVGHGRPLTLEAASDYFGVAVLEPDCLEVRS